MAQLCRPLRSAERQQIRDAYARQLWPQRGLLETNMHGIQLKAMNDYDGCRAFNKGNRRCVYNPTPEAIAFMERELERLGWQKQG